MKINPIGVQSYQELVKRDQPQAQQPPRDTESAGSIKPLNIEPQDEAQRSRLAVKAPRASYADNLTEAEQRALELLFSRFRDTGRFGTSYRGASGPGDEEVSVGRHVDVKA